MTTAAALIAGLATSLHCAGMCGPIACGLTTLSRSEGERLGGACLYHGGRLLSYALIGTVCGALGQQPLQWFFDSPAVLLPWFMVALLLIMGLGLEKRLPKPAFLARLTARIRFGAGRMPVLGGAATMGLLTPLLPCGPLYLIFGAALLSGSAAKGAEFTLAFGLGTVPLLWIVQHQFHRIRLKLTPVMMGRLRRGLALSMAVLLAWRLHGTLPLSSASDDTLPGKDLPSCCH